MPTDKLAAPLMMQSVCEAGGQIVMMSMAGMVGVRLNSNQLWGKLTCVCVSEGAAAFLVGGMEQGSEGGGAWRCRSLF